ncbi:MAG: hypothetical protein CBC55_00020 [Gammaproteobacteria bacterium TMED95]|nr:MAG: hypothetical protein CBC55_00020 [Gammaproteobacteria bacterium TMED95]
MRTTKKYLLILLISVASPAFGQDTPEVDPVPEVDPPPVRDDGEYEPEFDTDGDDTNIEGDLNTSNSNNGNVTKTFNGAGSRSMPASTAIAPSLMSNGTQSCLKSLSGGVQLVGIGLSSGMYRQDEECNRRLNAITLSNMGMKVASVSLMCQNAQVWRAMFMSATPCPIIRSGRLLVGKNALLAIKQNPELWIPDYEEESEFYDQLLAGGGDENSEQDSTDGSLSERFRSTLRDRN